MTYFSGLQRKPAAARGRCFQKDHCQRGSKCGWGWGEGGGGLGWGEDCRTKAYMRRNARHRAKHPASLAMPAYKLRLERAQPPKHAKQQPKQQEEHPKNTHNHTNYLKKGKYTTSYSKTWGAPKFADRAGRVPRPAKTRKTPCLARGGEAPYRLHAAGAGAQALPGANERPVRVLRMIPLEETTSWMV